MGARCEESVLCTFNGVYRRDERQKDIRKCVRYEILRISENAKRTEIDILSSYSGAYCCIEEQA